MPVVDKKEMHWLTISSQYLFVRQCYHELWEIINEHYLKYRDNKHGVVYHRILILGTPGIGKTAFLNFVLCCALNNRYPVLFETRRHRFLFDFDSDGKWSCLQEPINHFSLERHRDRTDVILLHDHLAGFEPPQFTDGAFTVAPVSPEENNYNQFVKHECLKLYIPLPSLKEIELMRDFYRPELTNDEMNKRLMTVGRIPRYLFAINFEQVELDLESKIISFDVEKFVSSTLFTSAILPKEKQGLSWWIVHADVNAVADLAPSRIIWASEYVRNEVLSSAARRNLKSLEHFVVEILQNCTIIEPPTGSFEYWSIYSIAASREIFPKSTSGTSLGSLRFDHLDVVSCQNLAKFDVLLQNKGKMIYSIRKDENHTMLHFFLKMLYTFFNLQQANPTLLSSDLRSLM